MICKHSHLDDIEDSTPLQRRECDPLDADDIRPQVIADDISGYYRLKNRLRNAYTEENYKNSFACRD
jgi:hypothetical protein